MPTGSSTVHSSRSLAILFIFAAIAAAVPFVFDIAVAVVFVSMTDTDSTTAAVVAADITILGATAALVASFALVTVVTDTLFVSHSVVAMVVIALRFSFFLYAMPCCAILPALDIHPRGARRALAPPSPPHPLRIPRLLLMKSACPPLYLLLIRGLAPGSLPPLLVPVMLSLPTLYWPATPFHLGNHTHVRTSNSALATPFRLGGT